MPLLRFLFGCAGGALIAAIAANVVGGVGTAGLLFVIHGVLEASSTQAAMSSFGLLFIGLVLLTLVSKVASAYLSFDVSHGSLLTLRKRLASLILRAPLQDVERMGASPLLAAFTEDINAVVSAVPGIPVIALNVAIVVTCLGFMLWLSPGLGFAALGLFLVAVGVYYRLTTIASTHYSEAEKAFQRMFSYFRALTEGIKELKLHRSRREAYTNDIFLPSARAYREFMLKASMLNYGAHSFVYLLILTSMGFILFALPANEWRSVSMGYALTLLFVGPPLETIVLWIPSVVRANVAFNHIRGLESTLSAAPAESDLFVGALPSSSCMLELAGVGFEYPAAPKARPFIFGPVNLRFSAGEVVFIVGGNGGGKSTLVKLLGGLYRPMPGHIAFNGVPIDDQNREWYRQHFSIVFSEVFLFERLLGIDDRNLDARATAQLEALGLADVVHVAHETFSRTDLSSGQRKRLALAVARLEDRQVYIFDEWAAGQDPAFKRIFYHDIIPDLKAAGKMVIAVTHDETYFSVANRIVRVEEGQVLGVAGRPTEAQATSDFDTLASLPHGLQS
jgi:putative ATP-binding cassette transporter